MPTLSRRNVLRSAAAAVAGTAFAPLSVVRAAPERPPSRIPLLHITDLYHPPQDPDDLVDLATIIALDEFDLRGVILDITDRFIHAAPDGFDIQRDPGFIPIQQIAYLTGRTIPMASGPAQPLASTEDQARDRPLPKQAGVELILDVLRHANAPVVVSVVGSARPLAVAFNREPDLLLSKVQSVLLNAGFTAGTRREWNVDLDVNAFVALWRSGLPIHWYPCATESGAFSASHERGTFWRAPHADLLKDLPQPLRAWFAYGFSGSARGDIIGSLADFGRGSVWDDILRGERNMWATASLAMAAGRVLGRTSDGWRFARETDSNLLEVWPWRLDRIDANAAADGSVAWQLSNSATAYSLFGRRAGSEFSAAMAEATNALLRRLPVNAT